MSDLEVEVIPPVVQVANKTVLTAQKARAQLLW